MINFVVYDSTGAIVYVGSCDPSQVSMQTVPSGCMLIQVDTLPDPGMTYFPGGVQTVRPVLSLDKLTITPNGVDAAHMTGIPSGGMAFVDNVPVAIAGGSLTVTTTSPHGITVNVEAFPCQNFTAVITAS